jgi:transposase
MKRDCRTLDHATLETIRKMAVVRVREGERPSEVIASFGMHRCTIYGWLKAARGRGKGLKSLASKPATGRPRMLSVAQERQVFRWINGKNPMQYGFDFGLWTRQIARDLIAQRFAVRLSLTSVGGLLARVGLTPQKPLQRAYQRDPEAIARWHPSHPFTDALADPPVQGHPPQQHRHVGRKPQQEDAVVEPQDRARHRFGGGSRHALFHR